MLVFIHEKGHFGISETELLLLFAFVYSLIFFQGAVFILYAAKKTPQKMHSGIALSLFKVKNKALYLMI